MKTKTKGTAKFYFLLFILLCVLLVGPGSSAAAAEPPTQTTYQQQQIARWEKLEAVLQQQAVQLEMARITLARLKTPQAQLVKLLQEAELQLTTCRRELASANGSLTTAYDLTKKLQILCEKLKQDLEAERQQAKKAKHKAIKNAFLWGLLIGAGVGAAATNS